MNEKLSAQNPSNLLGIDIGKIYTYAYPINH